MPANRKFLQPQKHEKMKKTENTNPQNIISHRKYLAMKKNPHLLTEEHRRQMREYEAHIRATWPKIPEPQPQKFRLLNGYDDLLAFFKETASNFVENYVLDEENIVPVDFALRYFYGLPLPDGVAINKPSHKKGLLFFGNYGTGKSMFFNIIRAMRPHKMHFQMTTAADIVALYENAGERGITHMYQSPLFIDELGAEKTGVYYGSRMNVLKFVLLKRYNLFVDTGKRTHATTNLTMDEIREQYGPRVYSRFFEMFNLVPFGAEPDARDFRMLK